MTATLSLEPNVRFRAAAPVRVTVYCPWADGLEDANEFLRRLPGSSLDARLPIGADAQTRRMARLDCDWFGECVRCFTYLGPAIATLPARVVGRKGIADFVAAAAQKPVDECWWWIIIGQHAQNLGPLAGRVCEFLRRSGVRILLYSYDEASRTMPCFGEVAPHLSALIHDESPLDPIATRRLAPDCVRIHRSWVANIVPFAAPFNERPEQRIVFLGSALGLTPHRERQFRFLQERFKDRFVAIHDHSVGIEDRFSVNRFAVSLCPEGRKFATPAMSQSHTDRPFWSGCLGLVPVSENSAAGNRLQSLAAAKLIVRYPRGDLDALAASCEEALSLSVEHRRRIYEYFNRYETVGGVVADVIAAAA